MENGLIPPNIHYNEPREEIKGLVEGRMKVVTENVPFPDDRGLVGTIVYLMMRLLLFRYFSTLLFVRG